jgi:hypothetical protein
MLYEFGIINSKLFILIIFPISSQIRRIIISCINDNNIFQVFRTYLSYILSFIFILIINYRTKKDKIVEGIEKRQTEANNKERNSSIWINPLKEKENLMNKEKRKKNILFIIFLTVIDLSKNIFSIIFRTIYNDDNAAFNLGKQSIGIFLEILLLIVISKFILKTSIYRHNLLSLIIILFNLLLISISYIHYFLTKTISVTIYYLFNNFLLCLLYVFGKKYLDSFYVSPYNLILYIGIICSFIFLVYDLIVYLIVRDNNDNIHGIILGFQKNGSSSFVILFLLDIIFSFSCNIGIWLSIYYFTPFHFIISELISEYIYYTYDWLFGDSDYEVGNIILYSLIYLINLFFSLIFNEIIILNFWGLEFNTKKNIEKRQRNDEILANSDFYLSFNSCSSDKNINERKKELEMNPL